MEDMTALLEEIENGIAYFVSQEKDKKDLYIPETLLPSGYQVGSLYSIKKRDKKIVLEKMENQTQEQLDKVSEKRKKLLKRSDFKKRNKN